MSDCIRVYGALPIARNDAGDLIPDYDATTRHENANEACLAAEKFARTPPYVAAVAVTRFIDLVAVECSRPEALMSFGDAPPLEQWLNG